MEINNLYQLVIQAQNDDEQAMSQIILMFLPAIRAATINVDRWRREDIEQSIIEILIKKILTYNIDQTPDFSTFCEEIIQSEN